METSRGRSFRRGNLVEYAYDTAGRLTSIERKPDPSTPGERTLYTLDQAGHRIKEELQRWDGGWVTTSWTEYRYQNRCQIGKVVHADGNVTEYAYDCDGNLEQVWDASHSRATHPQPTQRYQYDPLNRMTSVTQPWTGAGGATAVTSYAYDALDHLTAVTDAEANTTTYEYSDRGLMTEQTSPVSGVTTYAYNEHGEQVSEIDARGVVMNRLVDALDRVTAIQYPSADLDVTYTYDDPAVTFSKGRLTSIDRQGQSVNYRYDRFGRILEDGALSYGYDANGNPTSLLYPGGVEAVTTYDFADRPATLVAKRPGQPDQPLVTVASYLPSGPLSSVTLGNGLTETRTYSSRYLPTGISVPGRLNWSYSTDAVGNILEISESFGSARTFGYQDYQYFLTHGNGPWGARTWTYDKIGNRLTETRDAVTDTYLYVPNAAGKNTPQLDRILPNGGTAVRQYHDAAGNLIDNGKLTFTYGEDRRLEQTGKYDSGTTYTYDGRGFLHHGTRLFPEYRLTDPPRTDETEPTYSSTGLLHHRFSHWNLTPHSPVSPTRASDLYLFHFAGRPIATLDNATEGTPATGYTTTETWHYLTTDHLGTPILITSPTGAQLWQGGFEPFGADYSSAPTILRFPGQWVDETWGDGKDGGLYYNVHRWYEAGRGWYTSPDPLPATRGAFSAFGYALSQPTRFIDTLGLFQIDPSCDNLECVPQHFGYMNMLRQLRLETQWQCETLAFLITDVTLLGCLQRKCDSGKIYCRGADDDPANNCNFGRAGAFGPPGGEATLCPGNWTYGVPPGYLGETVIHEWAHNCGWRHGGGQGVPNDPGE